MGINRKVDIIRDNQANKDYLNVNSKNRIIARLVGASAENIYGFSRNFRNRVDNNTQKEMEGTYWIGVSSYDNSFYGENVQIAVL